ncbi:MAG: leucyl aminopeptidase [Pseudomonadota bacterium]
MTTPAAVHFAGEDLSSLASMAGTVVVLVGADKVLSQAGDHVDGLTGGNLRRVIGADGFKPSQRKTQSITWPSGMAAEKVVLASLGTSPDRASARQAGGAIASAMADGPVTICTGGVASHDLIAEMICAAVLRLYSFDDYRKATAKDRKARTITVTSDAPEALAAASAPFAALAEGIYFTRDLVNEPANTLNTDEFAARLAAMGEMGLDVEILGEAELEEMGARALLGVGQGSVCESKLVVMKWMGGGDEAPLALVGKGVVFDTGGISLKPASGMEDMTMDMGGAGVVSGVMRTLALRKAKANVVGIVGLVENMPDAAAQRPGDIVTSMKGDTIEIINTDAEGRLVLADALWYTQETFNPSGIIDLATLTGAIIVGLSKSMAGHFCNDEDLNAEYLAACEATGDKSWRMPLDESYHKQIESTFADVKNTGGRNGGSCTAAAFLEKFIKDDMPWIHIDIAGVTTTSSATHLAPKGATGWGVAALDQLVRRREA